MFKRNRFADLIARQLDIFGQENAELLVEIGEYRERWRRSARDGAEEAFGAEQDRIDWAAEARSCGWDEPAGRRTGARRNLTRACRSPPGRARPAPRRTARPPHGRGR